MPGMKTLLRWLKKTKKKKKKKKKKLIILLFKYIRHVSFGSVHTIFVKDKSHDHEIV